MYQSRACQVGYKWSRAKAAGATADTYVSTNQYGVAKQVDLRGVGSDRQASTTDVVVTPQIRTQR